MKTITLCVALFTLIVACVPQPTPIPVRPTPVGVRTAYDTLLPLIMASASVRKGLAGYRDDDGAVWQSIGISQYYNWGHLCTVAELSATSRPACIHSARSKTDQVFWLYDDDGCGAYSQAELQSCIIAKAARWPQSVWLVGNEPDGPDPAYSDNMTPVSAADHYGQIINAIRAGNPQARVYCCGFVLPMNLTSYASDFAAAWRQRWGTPFSSVGGFAFHIYSTVGSSCALDDAVCLQAAFDAQLAAGISWAAQNGFARASVTEFGWTPFDSQQSITLNAARLTSMCNSLRASSLDSYFIYHAPSPSPFALLNALAAYPIQPTTLNAAGAMYKDC